MISIVSKFYKGYLAGEGKLAKTHDLVSLIARFYVAQVFFNAGLTKIQDWDTTLFLFEEEYQVPFLPFELAAYLGTLGELILPILLVTGILTRFSAVGLFFVNVVAVISLVEIAPAALYLHYIWGLVLAQIIIYGGGVLSVDHVSNKFLLNRHKVEMEPTL
ncbi:DoxX family protein [Neptuniibacter sp. QD72_48]|uniref:DoxX family protein n=1 Tax=Neptuniibacter sp. QD72_48 TaxID=3398214 RepID=UPI0039F581D3